MGRLEAQAVTTEQGTKLLMSETSEWKHSSTRNTRIQDRRRVNILATGLGKERKGRKERGW